MSGADVGFKIAAMKKGIATSESARNKPVELYRAYIVRAFRAHQPKTKEQWADLLKSALSDTIAQINDASHGLIKQKEIRKALYKNQQADTYKVLSRKVPKGDSELFAAIDAFSDRVNAENNAFALSHPKMDFGVMKPLVAVTSASSSSEPEGYVTMKLGPGETTAEEEKFYDVEPPPGHDYGQEVSSFVDNARHHLNIFQQEMVDQGVDPKLIAQATEKAARQVFELETSIDLSDISSSGPGFVLAMEKGFGSFQDLVMNKERQYLGGHRGGYAALMRQEKPTDELDAIAQQHDLAYLLASTIANKDAQRVAIKRADHEMMRELDRLAFKTGSQLEGPNPDAKELNELMGDIRKTHMALTAKGTMDWLGVSPSDWMTPGATRVKAESVSDRAAALAKSMADFAQVVYDSTGKQENLKTFVQTQRDIADDPSRFYPQGLGPGVGKKVPKPLTAASLEVKEEKESGPPPQSYHEPIESEHQATLAEPVEITSGETEVTQQGTGRVKRVAMDLEGVLSELEKMNRPTAAPTDIYSLKPITGERNLRPMLVAASDDPRIVQRTKNEESANMDFYGSWKVVQPGWGNGNQEPMPDQIGAPFKNNLLRAQWENQSYQFTSNFDAGARQWYSKTHKPHQKRLQVLHSRETQQNWRQPMIRDNQTHQLPVRNGSLPAGVGRAIHFARETPNGFDLFTPTQMLSGRETRLFHGDVVDGLRV